MAKQYNITITNGTGSANVLNDNYTIESNTNGYLNSSIIPNAINVVDGTNTYEFTISAEGALTLHVTENGEAGGTAVVGAKFIRCDAAGNTYGSEVTTDSSGNAVFEHLPYATADAPKVYYRQTATDDAHTFDNTLKEISLDASTKTFEVVNPLPALRTFNLTDAYYDGLKIETGTIVLK